MTKISNFTSKIKGGGREGDTCQVLRPCHPSKIWNVHKIRKFESSTITNDVIMTSQLVIMTS